MQPRIVTYPRMTAAGASGRIPTKTWASMLKSQDTRQLRVSVHKNGKVYIGACALMTIHYLPTEEVKEGMRRFAHFGRSVGDQPVQRMTQRDAWINEEGYQYLLKMTHQQK